MLSRIFKYLTLTFVVLLLDSCSDNNNDSDVFNKICATSISLSNSKQAIDIWYDGNLNLESPVVVFIHGGGWNSGDKSVWDVSFANAFLSFGITSVSLNYRLAPHVTIAEQLNDIDEAISWINDNIGFYGGDSSKIYIVGHSAGAHLAALAGLKNDINGIICIDGGEYLNEMPDNMSEDSDYYILLKDVFRIAIGNNEPSKYVPYYQVESGKRHPIMLLYQADEQYRALANEKFAEKLRLNGYYVSMFPTWNLGHMGVYNQLANSNSAAMLEVIDFIRSH
ncbi:MAG: alpha/beta hydrolase [Duncaniella sp.]|nr:alpha/beta hydrolase [Duncaniella sp.]